MSSRVAIRSNLRAISELAIVRILGKVPRKLRRSAGRVYANEAYRHFKDMPMLKHGSISTNRTVIVWVSREYSRYVEGLDAKASSTNDVGSSAGGPGERTPEVSFIPVTEDQA